MPKVAKVKLTDTIVKNLKPKEKSYQVFDAGTPWPGLYIEVFPDGAKRWRYIFTNPETRKQSRMGLGVYPQVSLAEARESHARAAKMVKQGINPIAAKKAAKATEQGATQFKTIAEEWFMKEMVPTRAPSYVEKIKGRLANYIYPALGSCPVDEITPSMLNKLRADIFEKRGIEKKGSMQETARRVISYISQVFDYAKRKSYISFDAINPALALHGSWPRKVTQHYQTITDPINIGKLFIKAENYSGQFETICALKLSFYVMLRPGELRQLKWSYVDFENKILQLPIDIMKASRIEKEMKSGQNAHSVPLARQAFEIIESLHKFTGNFEYLFPGKGKEGCMSNNTVNKSLRRMGCDGKQFGKIRAHRFRGMASTVLHNTDYSLHAYIEKQLSHKIPDGKISAAYNHAQYDEQRREMLQNWADMIDQFVEMARREAAQPSA